MRIRLALMIACVMANTILFSSNALACSCIVSRNVDSEFATSPNVVILKAESIVKQTSTDGRYRQGGIESTVLTVEKVFKGSLKVGDKIRLAQGGGADCIWTFRDESIGESYLFYLGDKPLDPNQFRGMIASTSRGNLSVAKDVWVASTCSRSGNIKHRTLDLKYLYNIEKQKGKTRLSGNMGQRIETAITTGTSEYRKLRGRNVRVIGESKDLTVQTDENGDYEIYDLKPGKYKVSVEPVVGYKTTPFDWKAQDSVDLEIKPNEHAEYDFEYSIHNSISGVFLDSNRNALKGVCMDLVPSEGERARWFRNLSPCQKLWN